MLFKNGFILLLIILASINRSILFILQPNQHVAAQTKLVYENEAPGLRVPYPSNWSVNEKNVHSDGTGYIEFLPPDEQSSIRVGNGYQDVTPESIAKITIQEIARTFEDFRLIDEGPLNINSKDAYDIFLTYNHPTRGMVNYEYIFLNANNRLYTFSLQDTVTLGEYPN